jgi:branched-chain amino acid transport system substrate-binding protein
MRSRTGRGGSRRNRRAVFVALMLGVGMVAGGCGEDDSTQAAAPADSKQAAGGSGYGEQPASGGLASAEVGAEFLYGEDAKKWIGKEADESLPPVVLGWVNAEGGIFGRPWLTRAARTAVKTINTEYGGIAGHPLELQECLISSEEEEGQSCAQEFSRADAVKVIVQGDSIIGGAAFQKTLNGEKPTVGSVPYGPELTGKNTYMLTGGAMALGAMQTYGSEQLNAKKAALLFVDTPITRTISEGVAQAGERVGITSERSYYKAGATDLLGPLTAANLNEADFVFAGGTDAAQCIALHRAFEQLKVTKPIIGMSSCLNQEVKDAVGDFPKWHYLMYHTSPFSPAPNSQPALFVEAMEKYGKTEDAFGWYSPLAFGQTFTVARVLNDIGVDKLTSQAFSEKMAAYTGPAFMTPPDLKFGSKPFPTVGSAQVRVYEYLGNDEWEEPIPEWISAPGA